MVMGRLFRIFVTVTLAVVLLVCALQVQLDAGRQVQVQQVQSESARTGQWLEALKPTKVLKPIRIPGADSWIDDMEAWGANISDVPFARLSAELRQRCDWLMVVRHPVQRIVSVCTSLLSKRINHAGKEVKEVNGADLNSFLQGALNGTQLLDTAEAESIRPMMDHVDASVVQHIVRYETLTEDLPKLLQFYNMPWEHLPVRELEPPHPKLWPTTLQLIYENFSEDFLHFNYSKVESPEEGLTTSATSTTTATVETTKPAAFLGISAISLPSLPWRRRKELKFIHITKTGGSAIEEWAKSHGLLWGRFHSEYRAPGRAGSPWHHPFPKLPLELRHRYDWFMVVRNPVHRVVSEYYCPWTGTKTPLTDSEEAFNKFVQSSLDGSRWLHPGSFQAMSDYLDPMSVQHILHFESLTKDLARLLPEYGIPFEGLPRSNVATHHKFNSSNLWPATLKLIRKKYAADFQNFNYTC